MLTDRQKNLMEDIRKSALYLKEYGVPGKPVSLQMIIDRAGIVNAGSFYSVIDTVKKRRDPEGIKYLTQMRAAMKEVGVTPECIKTLPKAVSPAEQNVMAEMVKVYAPSPPSSSSSPQDSDAVAVAWNACYQALKPLPQNLRENVVHSVSFSFGLGAH